MQDTDRDLLPEGLGDRLPAQARAAQHVRRVGHDVLASHGYARVEPPLLEFEKSLEDLAFIATEIPFAFWFCRKKS